MALQHWSTDAVLETPAFLAHADTNARARADSLMTWGHTVAFGGSVAGIAGGFSLVAHGSLSAQIVALLFAAPVAGLLVSGLLYAAAWYADTIADRKEAAFLHSD